MKQKTHVRHFKLTQKAGRRGNDGGTIKSGKKKRTPETGNTVFVMCKTSEEAAEWPVLPALFICTIAYGKQTPCSLKTADSGRSEGVRSVFPNISGCFSNMPSSRSVYLRTDLLPYSAEAAFSAPFLHSKPWERLVGGTPSRSSLSRCSSISALASVTGSSAWLHRLHRLRLPRSCAGLTRPSCPAGQCWTHTGHDGLSGNRLCFRAFVIVLSLHDFQV